MNSALDEKNLLADIEYTYKRQGIRTSENEITRIAINYFIEDYRQNGEQSLLAKLLKHLNSWYRDTTTPWYHETMLASMVQFSPWQQAKRTPYNKPTHKKQQQKNGYHRMRQ